VQAGQVMVVYPGPGIVAFGAVVIITMIAAMTFEPQLLWRDSHGQREP
jgi:paraquat-inducible protein A